MLQIFFLIFLVFNPCLFSNELLHLPFADSQGIVISSKVIKIKGPKYPFNASITYTQDRQGYWLFFREDFPGATLEKPNGSHLGVVPLDQSFEQTGEAFYPSYPIFGKTVEDPRVFWIQDQLFLLYFVYPRPSPACPCLAQLDPTSLTPQTVHLISKKDNPEKNWVPLVSSKTTDTLIFLRTLYPQNPVSVNLLSKQIQFTKDSSTIKMQAPKTWKWGSLSGGTQAELIDESTYLAFFHSWFGSKNGKRIYVMGACTFDKKSPYKMKTISPHPILFKKIYTARARNQIGEIFSRQWAQHIEKVIFPCGFVFETTPQGKELIHVSCGENDNSIRIVTFDKTALLQSLIPVQ